jgi:hypothetical protein
VRLPEFLITGISLQFQRANRAYSPSMVSKIQQRLASIRRECTGCLFRALARLAAATPVTQHSMRLVCNSVLKQFESVLSYLGGML